MLFLQEGCGLADKFKDFLEVYARLTLRLTLRVRQNQLQRISSHKRTEQRFKVNS